MQSTIYFEWDGEHMVPASCFAARLCDERFVVGERYPLEEVHARSTATHAHYFAVLKDLWLSLPEHMADQYPSVEKLRKTALIRTGYHTQVQHVCKSGAEAERLASMIRSYDEYQIILVEGVVVTVFHAMSQDRRSMDQAKFQASKEAVMNWCADLVGVTPQVAYEQGENA